MNVWHTLDGKKTNLSLLLFGIGTLLKAFGLEWGEVLIEIGGGGMALGATHKLTKGT